MPSFAEDVRPILLAVSHLSGPDYRDVDGEDLQAYLSSQGYERSDVGWIEIMNALSRRDPGYLTWHRTAQHSGAASFKMIRLTGAGAQEVEGWPTTPGVVPETEVAGVLAALEQAAENAPTEEQRSGLREVADHFKAVPATVTAAAATALLKHFGLG